MQLQLPRFLEPAKEGFLPKKRTQNAREDSLDAHVVELGEFKRLAAGREVRIRDGYAVPVQQRDVGGSGGHGTPVVQYQTVTTPLSPLPPAKDPAENPKLLPNLLAKAGPVFAVCSGEIRSDPV